jgi:endonuclease-3
MPRIARTSNLEPRTSLPRKRPHDISAMLRRIRATVREFADAAMFAFAAEGHTSVFEQLVACIISIRTRDEMMLELARNLFKRAPTPAAMARLDPATIDALIGTSSFHEAKARQIHEIARRTVTEFDGRLPCDFETLTSFRGVGPKCANLALGIACGHSRIGVDIHVHRVTNRWGYVDEPTPERTMLALEKELPKKYWVEINRLLVPFGKHVCTGVKPKCSTCPVLEYCRQVGVTEHR